MLDPTSPTSETSRAAGKALRSLYLAHPTGLVLRFRDDDVDGEVELPAALVPLLLEILEQMAKGNGVRVVPVHAELTTQQAADILNTSRPYLIKLLEGGAIPFHLTGAHRRVKLGDLLVYKRVRDAERRVLLDELSAQGQDLGLDE